MRVNPIGTVEVLTGSHSHGQGHETTFAQLVSSRLGIPIENVSVVHGDTDKVQFGMGTYGSRSGAVGMSAISKALDKIEAKAKKVAGHVLEASEEDIEFKDGKFTVKGTDKSIDFGSVALNAYIAHKFNGQELEPGLKETAFWDPTNFTFPAGVHICELEIDPETGVVTIDRWTAVDDFGKLINPMIVEGQVHGGVAQGIGQALMEGAHYDSDGQLLTASYMDYCMPRADDLPSFKVDTTETPCPSNPLGIKGCGEAGAIASPPAVINAITDALGHEDVADAGDAASRLARRAEGRDASAPRNEPEPEADRRSASPSFGDFPMYAFEYHRPQTLSGAVADLAKAGRQSARRRHDAAADDEAAARLAGRARRSQGRSGACRRLPRGRQSRHRRDDPPRRRRPQPVVQGGDPGARHARRRHRRPACAQPRHDRRLARQQRSGRRLSRRRARARRDDRHQQAPHRRRRLSSTGCSRPRSSRASSSPRSASRSRRRRPT